MSSLALIVAYIFSKLAIITANIRSSFFDVSLPGVPSLLAGYDNGLLYALNPCAFLARCQ